jgi:proline-specific peptidase
MPWSFDRRLLLRGCGALLALVVAGLPLPGAAELPKPDRAGHIDVPGGRVWYALYGAKHLLAKSKAALVAVQRGPGGSHEDLLALAELANERPVVLYDQLDSGASDKPNDPANWTVRRFVAELAAIRAELGLDRLVVLGQSWGGAIVADYAMARPPGLLGLVMSSPLVSTPRALADMEDYRNKLPEDVLSILKKHESPSGKITVSLRLLQVYAA